MFYIARLLGMKYIVTRTMLSNVTLCLISNYHTKGMLTSNLGKFTYPYYSIINNILGYKHLLPISNKGEILI
jgi:hypothetical protein